MCLAMKVFAAMQNWLKVASENVGQITMVSNINENCSLPHIAACIGSHISRVYKIQNSSLVSFAKL